MRTKIICTLILFIIFSCKKDETKSFKKELTQSIQKKITQELKQDGSSLESIQLVKFDTLKEWQEADFVSNYSTQRLIILNKQQQQLTKELENVKTIKDLERIKSKYTKVEDSMKHEIKIIKSVEYLKPKNIKTGNYQAIFLLKVHDRKSDTVKNDSLFMFTNEKKVIFTSTQFIEQCIVKFK
ncbi:hypothetical protein [Chryseobacterium sp. JM1]|uniref:hypothetical protein n=1 Tax=Chryseobacterium sp. JM1 TaxID=1233950 RepID=UPI0004E63DCA|nr:hypothetical protein [Chryseobacterium sp. JM1]KFF21500.1 hypothetical protein IW22_05930 [Chryseobacterium sp. JM1]